jgi:hypothetical protein
LVLTLGRTRVHEINFRFVRNVGLHPTRPAIALAGFWPTIFKIHFRFIIKMSSRLYLFLHTSAGTDSKPHNQEQYAQGPRRL